MKIAIYTLGCKVNQYETQAMEAELQRRGHTLVPFDGPADAYIINTCSVTAVADKKSRSIVRRARRQNGGAVVAVCGCYVQTHADQAAGLGADLLTGTGDHMALLDELERLAGQRPDPAPLVQVDDPFVRRDLEALPAGGLAGRTRALLKAEDGCSNFCSYCIIPYARGPVRSMPLADAQAEAARLAAEGCRELVLTGIELSSWGWDLEDRPPLARLIEGVCAAAPGLRVRLGSLEPRTVTEDFCRRCAGLPNLCPHFHLSLQSGCDDTLRRMKRRYDTRRYLQSVELLRRFFPDCAVTTDLITGFPGETEEEFSQTLRFIEQCAFSSMHIFPYSPRPGTPAAGMPDQVPPALREERVRRAGQVAAEMERRYLERWVGATLPVLFETGSKGHAPNYVQVQVDRPVPQNTLADVSITGVGDGVLLGQMKNDEEAQA